MVDYRSVIGKVAVEHGTIYIRPEQNPHLKDAMEYAFMSYGITPTYCIPALGAELPEALAEGFPSTDPQFYLYSFTPLPWVKTAGINGEIDCRKAKEAFAKLHGQDITLTELIASLNQSIVLRTKDVARA